MPHPDTFRIKPAPDMSADPDPVTGKRPCLRIADPKTGAYLPEEGMLMPRSGFWIRRHKDGDVVLVSAPAAKEEAPPLVPTQPVNPEPIAADVKPAQDARPALSRAEGDGCEPETTLSGETTSPTASVRTGRADRASSKKE